MRTIKEKILEMAKFSGSSLASASQLKKYLISLKMIQKEDL